MDKVYYCQFIGYFRVVCSMMDDCQGNSNRSENICSSLSDDDLDSMRRMGDDLADDILSKFPNQPSMQERVLMDSILTQQGREAFLSMEAAIRMERIRHLFSKYFPFTGLILLCGSLPAAYSAAKGAETLKCTGRMYKEPQKRIMETTLFLHYIFENSYLNLNDALLRDHPGFRAVIQVRLLHARVRRHVKALPKSTYDADINGVPVNQEDMLGTLTTFSFVVLLGLERLGFRLTTQERDDYSFFWSQIGSWMGCRYALKNLNEEEFICWKIRKRHNKPSEYSKEMVRVLFEKMAPPKSRKETIDRARVSLSTFCWMLDNDLASMLELEYSRLSHVKWTLCIYIFQAYRMVSYFYEQVFGRPIIDLGSLLGKISKDSLHKMDVRKPFMFSIV